MTTDLDEAGRNNNRAREALDEGASNQALAWCLNAQRDIIRHLRNSPADGKSERGEGPSAQYGEDCPEEIADAYGAWLIRTGFPASSRALAAFRSGYEAGQQSRLDERERAVLGAARFLVALPHDSSRYYKLKAAVDALDSAAKSDANPSK